MKKTMWKLLMIGCLVACCAFFAGCGEEGSAEEAGKAIDDAMSDAKDAAGEMADDAKKVADDVKDGAEELVDDAKKQLGDKD